MNVNISVHPQFQKDMKRLTKKYKSIVKDFNRFLEEIEQTPNMGTDLGNGVHKVRMAITSKGKGKSGGARIINYVYTLHEGDSCNIILLTIYDKSEISNVSDNYIKSLLATLA